MSQRKDKTMLKEKIGIVLISLAVMTANSTTLIVPATLMAIGLWLCRGLIGGRDESDEDC